MSALKTAALLCLPSVVLAILSNRRSEDKHLIKYFLPYGRMRKHILAKHRESHVRKVYGAKILKPLTGVKGLVRSCLPFGLVLWRDNDGRILPAPELSGASRQGDQRANPNVVACPDVASPDVANLDAKIDALRREISLRQDRLEVLVLRALRAQSRTAAGK